MNTQFVRGAVQLLYFIVAFLAWDFPYRSEVFIIMTILVGSFYCGWLCYFGFVQEKVSFLGSKIFPKKFIVPEKIDNALSYIRYITLFFPVVILIEWLNARHGFLDLLHNLPILPITLFTLTAVLVLSLFIERPFCRYLCPLGALYGVTSLARIFTIKRNEETCVHCRLCYKACPVDIKVDSKTEIVYPSCISCLRCINSCPKKDDTLVFGLRSFPDFNKRLILLIPLTVFLWNIFNKYS